jgi:hypothetical protein
MPVTRMWLFASRCAIIPDVSKRRQRLASQLGTFVRLYGRKADARHDPNDRRYDRGTEERVKNMKPQELDMLLRDETED